MPTVETLPSSSPLAISAARQFLGQKFGVFAIVSLILLIPCVWHPHIEAGDLGSHVYNAWLAQQAQSGHAPGVYLVRQWNNVLSDLAFSVCGKLFGWHEAELLVVAASVLVFFWGVFSFVAVVTKRAPWALLPCLAMLAYGYSFSMGFLNYYLSIGLACFALAAFWNGGRGNWITSFFLAPLLCLAHPIGFLWFIGTVAYISLHRILPRYLRWLLPILVFAGYVALRAFFTDSPRYDADWRPDPFYWMNGSDQLMLYGHRYLVLARIVLAWAVLCFLPYFAHLFTRSRAEAKSFRIPIELYLVALTAAAFVPENIHSDLFAGWIGLLVSRLTTVTAIFGLCILGLVPLRKWQITGFIVCAGAFFLFSFEDTGKVWRIEANAQALVAKLPPGTRIVPVVSAPEDWRVQFVGHSIERACVGHCFSYSNYEPSSGQFRLRAHSQSWVVTDSAERAEAMSSGDYVVRPEDLPLVAIYQCVDADWTQLCASALRAGNKTEDPEPLQTPENPN